MKIIILIIYPLSLFANNNFFNFETLNYPFIIYFLFISLFSFLLLPLFVNKKYLFSKILQYSNEKDLIKSLSFNKNNNKKNKRKLENDFLFKKKSTSEIANLEDKMKFKYNFKLYRYFFVLKSSDDINCLELNIESYKYYSKLYLKKNSLKNIDCLYYYKVKKSANIIGYFRLLFLLTKLPFLFKFLMYSLTLLPLFLTIAYIVNVNYFIKILSLLGIIPNKIELDFSIFLNFIFSDILIFFFTVLLSNLGIFFSAILIVVFLFWLFNLICLLFISKIKIPTPLLVSTTVGILFGNLLIYYISFFILFKILIDSLFVIYKIEYPSNENINIYDYNFYYKDYFDFSSYLSKIKVKNKYYFTVGNDSTFIYFYDVLENKNKLLLKEIKSLSKDNCNEITSNVRLSFAKFKEDIKSLEKKRLKVPQKIEKKVKLENRFINAKINTILINNNLLNVKLVKKYLIKDLLLYDEIPVNLEKDLFVDEIINKCEIIVNLKDEKVNYENFESMNNQELIKWIDKLEHFQKEKIKKVKLRIENEIEEDKKNTK